MDRHTILPRVLRKVYTDLVEYLNYKGLVDYLYENECINFEELETIRSKGIKQEQNRKLLDILMTKDDRALDVMLEYLRRDRSDLVIYQLLMETLQELGMPR